MPSPAKCSKCQRTYIIVGLHSRPTLIWTCPRCKRGRNLGGPVIGMKERAA